MARTAAQKAAARRNLVKARAARSRKGGKLTAHRAKRKAEYKAAGVSSKLADRGSRQASKAAARRAKRGVRFPNARGGVTNAHRAQSIRGTAISSPARKRTIRTGTGTPIKGGLATLKRTKNMKWDEGRVSNVRRRIQI
jgi:hypothetical protein